MIPDFFSSLAELPDPVLAAAVGALGLVIVEIIRTSIAKSKDARDDKRDATDDLREDIWKLKEALGKVEAERDKWRDDYWIVREKLVDLQAKVTVAEIKAKAKLDELQPPSVP